MSESLTLGRKGEMYATEHLKKKGYTILRKNWRAGKKEIDIVAENKDFIVFVEVKTRTDNFLTDPVSAITREKREALIFAADNYIKRFGVDKEVRFDVITVIIGNGKVETDHIEHAFYPTLR